jgi:hypothetical protein
VQRAAFISSSVQPTSIDSTAVHALIYRTGISFELQQHWYWLFRAFIWCSKPVAQQTKVLEQMASAGLNHFFFDS